VTVVLAAERYPAEGDRGSAISGVPSAEELGALVFHAGTALHGDRLVTNGGRVLAVTGVGASIGDARALAYAAADRITFAGVRFRSDVAAAPGIGSPFGIEA
jgi:phosphoribosylamine--glycine ligase